MKRESKQRRQVRETLRPPTETELRALAALIDRHVSIRPGKRWIGTSASIVAIHINRSTATARRALHYWHRRGIVRTRGPAGCWAAMWTLVEHHPRRRAH